MAGDAFTGEIEGYLEEYEGTTPLPEYVRDAIRAQLPSTRQHPAWWPTRRFSEMNNSAKLALAAAAVVVAAIVGLQVLVPRNVGAPQPTPPEATALPVATPGALPAEASLEPGRYFIANPYGDDDPVLNCDGGCPDFRSVSFTVPGGWTVSDGLVFKHRNQPNEVAFSVWAPGAVYPDPCHWQETVFDQTSVAGPWGPTDERALANQAGRGGSTPTAVTFGGEQTARLVSRIELSVPADLDLSTCDQGEYRSWTVWQVPDRANTNHAAGQIDVVYVVGLDRRSLFIDASQRPAASLDDLAELEAILDSMVINR
jgi:hypothetical protein